ncbi:hypothetical protein HBA55_34430 [Pseudomaricurvus alkylphenolicus]|uniref:hypothetical protein n=1 Tax=Pseudomaricurvus alkylphenolicus TaxID=1306991 RepID=UPI001422990A|nr:hypothetical protein [Pseudomaricurvus alkylphenolicus]NIB44728.1 hypothetical protein [Pseudomaricurvus alkylphenolicus]
MSFISNPDTNFGAYPILKGASLGAATPTYINVYPRYMPGWSANGDYVKLPDSASASIEYYNAAQTLQWSVAKTDLNAAVDIWCGITFDGTDIFVVGADTGTAPDTYYSAKINSAGVVTAIGNDQPTSDFSASCDFTGSGGNGFLQLNADGDLLLASSGQHGIINKTSGLFTTDPTSHGSQCSYEAPSGNRIGYFATSGIAAGQCRVYCRGANAGSTQVCQLEIPLSTGTPFQTSTENVRLIVWNGYVSQGHLRRCAAFWDKDVFDSWVDDVVRAGGFA